MAHRPDVPVHPAPVVLPDEHPGRLQQLPGTLASQPDYARGNGHPYRYGPSADGLHLVLNCCQFFASC